jgi:hypothetical protein
VLRLVQQKSQCIGDDDKRTAFVHQHGRADSERAGRGRQDQRRDGGE